MAEKCYIMVMRKERKSYWHHTFGDRRFLIVASNLWVGNMGRHSGWPRFEVEVFKVSFNRSKGRWWGHHFGFVILNFAVSFYLRMRSPERLYRHEHA